VLLDLLVPVLDTSLSSAAGDVGDAGVGGDGSCRMYTSPVDAVETGPLFPPVGDVGKGGVVGRGVGGGTVGAGATGVGGGAVGGGATGVGGGAVGGGATGVGGGAVGRGAIGAMTGESVIISSACGIGVATIGAAVGSKV